MVVIENYPYGQGLTHIHPPLGTTSIIVIAIGVNSNVKNAI
nr:MAG TPA: hypothetical protein [Caudoviricetes sp.]